MANLCRLCQVELHITREIIQEQGLQVVIGLISVVVTYFHQFSVAGFVYLLVGQSITINATCFGKQRRRLYGI